MVVWSIKTEFNIIVFCLLFYNYHRLCRTAGPWSMADEKVGGLVKNMRGPIKLLHVVMFEILKSFQNAFSDWCEVFAVSVTVWCYQSVVNFIQYPYNCEGKVWSVCCGCKVWSTYGFPDDIFKCIFLNENVWILNKISSKFVPKGPTSNIPALFQIMAWRRSGNKPLSGPMMALFHLSLSLRVQLVIFQHCFR